MQYCPAKASKALEKCVDIVLHIQIPGLASMVYSQDLLGNFVLARVSGKQLYLKNG